MKKINIFLMFIISLFAYNKLVTNVYAESANFYEGEYIDNIYIDKYQYSSKTIYYQKARFFRKNGTNEFAYCIEPFKFFNNKSNYTSNVKLEYLSNEQIDRITKLAYYGYGYQNHTDTKWYAITQLMIWQTADSNSGDYYFTDRLNGNRINIFQDEINELNNLIQINNTLPSFANKTYEIVEGHDLIIEDNNNVLNNYKIEGENYKVKNNKLIINNLKEGNYNYSFNKNENYYNTPAIFYQASDSQDLIQTGYINNLNTKINVNVTKTIIELSKIDKDTKSTIPSGEAILDGAKYILFDENHNKIDELIIDQNQAIVNNLNFGKYYIKEIEAGVGYTIDEKEYELELTKESNKIELVLENQVIKKKIILEKKFGENNNFYNEKDITFNIFNKNNELIDTITTNNDGIAEIVLPYGKYTIVQINTTDGYEKIKPLEMDINNNEEERIELKDLKIKVPNTHTEKVNYILLFIKLILIILW